MANYIKLHIKSLKIKAIIGILPSERKRKQYLLIDAILSYEYRGEFLDYLIIRDSLKDIVCREKYGLLEVATYDVAFRLFALYPLIQKIKIKFTKPNVSKNCRIRVSKTFKRSTFDVELARIHK